MEKGKGKGKEEGGRREIKECRPQILSKMTDRTRHLFILVCRERDQWLFHPSQPSR